MAGDLNERDAMLVQWLNEAHAKEAELEADLAAHIKLTKKAPYKKRLQQHLKETREHKRSVARRIKQLGGQASAGPGVPGVPGAVGEAAGKTVAAVKGQLGAARAAATEQAETHLRNAQDELREENVEIAQYLRIETFATEVGDRDTAQLAKRIGREEARMAKYLSAELPRLVKEVVRAEVPRDQRTTASRRTNSSRSRSQSTAATRRSGSSSGTARSSSGTARSSSGTARSSSGTSRSSSGASRSSSGASRSTASRSSGARRSTASRRSGSS